VLAVLNDPTGNVLAIHRGAKDSDLRISAVGNRVWVPLGLQTVKVPHGPPELTCALFSPSRTLWVGLRYRDRAKDPVDYGAAEIDLDEGTVRYHRQQVGRAAAVGLPLPADLVGIHFRSSDEAWFATRSGAARLLNGELRVFTENDGMESELVHDISPGPEGVSSSEVWVATQRGVGKFDGHRWSYPKMGPFYLPTRALATDLKGHVFLGTDKGLFCVGDCPPEALDKPADRPAPFVRDVAVDSKGRVWALTADGVEVLSK
jgi:hypothetical protein